MNPETTEQVSIIVPVLDEAEQIESALRALQPLRADGHEVLIVDGGSADRTTEHFGEGVDHVLRTPPGRAHQMNVGASAACGSVLVFLHVDTRLPPNGVNEILAAVEHREWGRFDVKLSGAHPSFRLIERLISLRSRWCGIATGDQAIFVRREAFQAAGGYPEIPLMEDVSLSKLLRRRSPPACLHAKVETSSRRWETQGIIATVLLMWVLRAAFALGVAPERLAAWYRMPRGNWSD